MQMSQVQENEFRGKLWETMARRPADSPAAGARSHSLICTGESQLPLPRPKSVHFRGTDDRKLPLVCDCVDEFESNRPRQAAFIFIPNKALDACKPKEIRHH